MQAPRPGTRIGDPFKDDRNTSRPWTITVTRRDMFGNLRAVTHHHFIRAEDAKAWKQEHEA